MLQLVIWDQKYAEIFVRHKFGFVIVIIKFDCAWFKLIPLTLKKSPLINLDYNDPGVNPTKLFSSKN